MTALTETSFVFVCFITSAVPDLEYPHTALGSLRLVFYAVLTRTQKDVSG